MLKRQSKIGNSDIAKFSPIYDKSTVGQVVGNSVDDYERILSQMRGVSRYWKVNIELGSFILSEFCFLYHYFYLNLILLLI